MQTQLQETRKQIKALQEALQLESDQFIAWHQSLDGIEERLQETVTRIAVVGSVKAGKSSFVNALLQQDLLKRGAGIMTSMITRIRSGRVPAAAIRFKSWSAIEAEAHEAFWLLTQQEKSPFEGAPDLRNPEARQLLSIFLQQQAVFSGQQDVWHRERHLLETLLHGYSEVQSYLGKEETILRLEAGDLSRHQRFVSQDALAVYMKDVLLECPSPLHEAVEVADCQGTDSPNPLHFAMVQEYLSQCSWVVYVISSRTGIRQADVQLLRVLEHLGLLTRTTFVVNSDFNEHETQQDWQRVVAQIETDLQRWIPHPPLVSVSALFRLFSQTLETLSPRDQAQYQLWQSAEDLVNYHESQWQQLEQTFHQISSQSRETLLAGESLHLRYLRQRILDFIATARQLSSTDQSRFSEIQTELETQQAVLRKTLETFKATLTGTLHQLIKRLKPEINTLFDTSDGPLVPKLYQFVEHYTFTPMEPVTRETLSSQITQLYQDIRQQLMRFVTEELNGLILHNLHQHQANYLQELETACAPYAQLLQTAIEKYLTIAQQIQPQSNVDAWHLPPLRFPDLPWVTFSTSLRTPSQDQVQQVYLLGKTWIRRQVGRWLGSSDNTSSSADVYQDCLMEAVLQLKKDFKEALDFDVLNYRENVKYLYLQKGLERLIDTLKIQLEQQLESTLIDLQSLSRNTETLQQQAATLLPQLNTIEDRLKASAE